MITTTKHQCAPENAEKFLMWIKYRGGIAIWKSVDLSSPEESWSAPVLTEEGVPYSKPCWQSANEPYRVITDPDEVEVVTGKEVKRFKVGLKQSGFKLKVTDGAQRNIDKALEKFGEDSWCEFDYYTQEAVIFIPGEVNGLLEFLGEN